MTACRLFIHSDTLRIDMLRQHNAVVRFTDSLDRATGPAALVTYRFPNSDRLRVDIHARTRPGEVERYIEIARELGYTPLGVVRQKVAA